QAEDQPHGGRLAGPVGAEEPGDPPWLYREAQVVDRDLAPIAFGPPLHFDHVAPSPARSRSARWTTRYGPGPARPSGDAPRSWAGHRLKSPPGDPSVRGVCGEGDHRPYLRLPGRARA